MSEIFYNRSVKRKLAICICWECFEPINFFQLFLSICKGNFLLICIHGIFFLTHNLRENKIYKFKSQKFPPLVNFTILQKSSNFIFAISAFLYFFLGQSTFNPLNSESKIISKKNFHSIPKKQKKKNLSLFFKSKLKLVCLFSLSVSSVDETHTEFLLICSNSLHTHFIPLW